MGLYMEKSLSTCFKLKLILVINITILLLGSRLAFANIISHNRTIVFNYNEEQLFREKELTGDVRDASGNPLVGVTIKVKGTQLGTVTDGNGRFALTVPDNAVLEISYVGFETKEISVGEQTNLSIQLENSSTGLNQLVVVGYGTQKKIDITGSIASIGSEELNKRSVTQASQLLAGELSGVTGSQSSGKPGGDDASIVVRGLGTFSGAGTSPLVIVDGIPASINSVNPNDIESISVLKDAASASIYGSRAANGVVLIKTKGGKKEKMQVSYNFYVGKNEPTALPQYVDSWTYAEMYNEALHNQGLGSRYTDEDIEKFKSGQYPDEFPNVHHADDLFHSGSGLQLKHNLELSGGAGNTQYLFSAGYLKQDGIVKKVSYDRYDLRLNLHSSLRDNLQLDVRSYTFFDNSNEPAMLWENQVTGLDGIMRAAVSFPATIPGRKSDGTYGTYMGHPTAEAGIDSRSFNKNKNSYFQNNVSLEWEPVKSLKVTGRVAYEWTYGRGDAYGASYDWDTLDVQGPSQLNVTTSQNRNLSLQLLMDYEKAFGDHHLHILGGASQIVNDNESLGAYREDFINSQLYVLNAASTTNDENYGTGYTTKLRSFFGRIDYSYKDKYLLQANLRDDGSSRFAEGHRYGLFPSLSVGWVISQEDFFKVPWIESLKIRGSYGLLGNQQIGNYPYQQTLDLNQLYDIGLPEVIKPGVALTTLPSNNISWETTSVIDEGLDANLFDGRLNITLDHYYKKTYNILYHLTVSNVLGMGVSERNAGAVRNDGWDFEVTYRNSIGGFNYSIRPTFSINNNKVLSLAGVEQDIAQGLFIGQPLSSIYGYRSDGLFIDQHDIDNYPTQFYDTKPGYPRYEDISGPDGKPDGKVDPQYDRTVIGNTFPKYSYGMGIGADFKNFDFYAFLQGQGGYQRQISGTQLALNNNGNIEQWQVDNRWTTEDPDRNAKYPRLEIQSGIDPPWGGSSVDYWIRDASFLRIKDIQIGYNIPKRLLDKTFISQFRIYLKAQNIVTFDSYYQGWDPEMLPGGYENSSYYPPTRQWIFGVNVNF